MGAATPRGWKITCTPPMVVGTSVHGVGQVALLSETAAAGPMGAEGFAKIEIISPAETGPVTKLAALVTKAMTGDAAATVNDTLTLVVPAARPMPGMTIPCRWRRCRW